MLTWPSETILYASDTSDAALTEAKEYIAREGLTKEQVALIKKGDMIMVRVK